MESPSTLSPARIEANRKNALKSTGPKTAEGKSRSRLNGLIHGLRARTVVLPGEDEQEYNRRCEDMARQLRPANALEATLVETLVASSWRLGRCRRAEKAALTQQVLDAEEGLAVARHAEVAGLIDRLASDPVAVTQRLWRLAEGCAWMAARWRQLGEALEDWGCWEPSQFHEALSLLGRRPGQVFADSLARDVASAYLGVAYDHRPGAEEIRNSLALPPSMPIAYGELPRQLARLAEDVFEPSEAMAYLRELIEQELAVLAELQKESETRHERDRLLARDRAMFDGSVAGEARSRYEMMHLRAFRGALRDLLMIRKAEGGGEFEVVEAEEVVSAPEPVEAPPPQVEAPGEAGPPAEAIGPESKGPATPSRPCTIEAPSEPKPDGCCSPWDGANGMGSTPILAESVPIR